MGLLNPRKTYELNYKGPRSGGCCLPFDTIAEAVAHAKARSATEYTILYTETGEAIAQGRRPDCRHKFTGGAA